eukprot:11081246-Alexandrium_andersonii.AAC.1
MGCALLLDQCWVFFARPPSHGRGGPFGIGRGSAGVCAFQRVLAGSLQGRMTPACACLVWCVFGLWLAGCCRGRLSRPMGRHWA